MSKILSLKNYLAVTARLQLPLKLHVTNKRQEILEILQFLRFYLMDKKKPTFKSPLN